MYSWTYCRQMESTNKLVLSCTIHFIFIQIVLICIFLQYFRSKPMNRITLKRFGSFSLARSNYRKSLNPKISTRIKYFIKELSYEIKFIFRNCDVRFYVVNGNRWNCTYFEKDSLRQGLFIFLKSIFSWKRVCRRIMSMQVGWQMNLMMWENFHITAMTMQIANYARVKVIFIRSRIHAKSALSVLWTWQHTKIQSYTFNANKKNTDKNWLASYLHCISTRI